jgi:hypothetical protein
MQHHLRGVATFVIALSAYAVLIRALRWMSQPTDRGWYGGITLILCLVLIVPFLIRMVWRKL